MLIISILLVGCNKVHLKSIETKPIDSSTSFVFSSLAVNDKGVYFIEDFFLYYMSWHNLKTAKLTTMAFADDKEVEDPYEIEFKNYLEIFSSGDLILYGDHLYGLYEFSAGDGSSKQTLSRMNLKGENLETLLTFDEFVAKFKIDSGNIYVYSFDEVNGKEFIEVYNNKLKSVEKLEFSLSNNKYDVYGFYLDMGELVIPENISTYDKPAVIIYDNDNRKISYEFSKRLDLIDFDFDEIIVKGIFENDDMVYELSNKLITLASDDYFYASNVADRQVYQQYNLDGTLNRSITPSDYIDSPGIIETGAFKSDFGQIERVYNDRYIFANTFGKYYMCDLELESCRYLNE